MSSTIVTLPCCSACLVSKYESKMDHLTVLSKDVVRVRPAVQCRLPISAGFNWDGVLALMGRLRGWPISCPFNFAFMVAMPASLQQISAVCEPILCCETGMLCNPAATNPEPLLQLLSHTYHNRSCAAQADHRQTLQAAKLQLYRLLRLQNHV